jgi:hypothetical protein
MRFRQVSRIALVVVLLFTSSFTDLAKATPTSGSNFTQSWNGCRYQGVQMWGSVYITRYPASADFTVYVSRYPSTADLKVFETRRGADARSCGRWYISKYQAGSRFSVYLTKYMAGSDFSIFVTKYPASAGR